MKLSDQNLALRVAGWLTNKGCQAVSVVQGIDGWFVYYTLKLDMKPQPAVRVRNGAVSFPAGSQEDVVFAFMLEQ